MKRLLLTDQMVPCPNCHADAFQECKPGGQVAQLGESHVERHDLRMYYNELANPLDDLGDIDEMVVVERTADGHPVQEPRQDDIEKSGWDVHEWGPLLGAMLALLALLALAAVLS